jgi:DNA adenine methylase
MKKISPLRYPGGKTLLANSIVNLIPANSHLYEVFAGGASVSLAYRKMYPEARISINDINYQLYCFWQVLRDCPNILISKIQEYRNNYSDGRELYDLLVHENYSHPTDIAAKFFVLNRVTFSGLAESGGYSPQAFKGRFTQSSIDFLRTVTKDIQGFSVDCRDFRWVIESCPSNVFLYLDPPYKKAESKKLYGKKGDLHTGFEHNELAYSLRRTSSKFVLSYDDCPEIVELYSFANVRRISCRYSMNNQDKSRDNDKQELLITNF